MRRDLHSVANSSTIVEFVTKSKTTMVREELGTLLNEFYKDGLENKLLFDLYEKVILRAYTTSMDYKDEELSILLLECYLVLFNFVNDRNQYLDSLKKRYESFQDLERKLRDSLKYLTEKI